MRWDEPLFVGPLIILLWCECQKGKDEERMKKADSPAAIKPSTSKPRGKSSTLTQDLKLEKRSKNLRCRRGRRRRRRRRASQSLSSSWAAAAWPSTLADPGFESGSSPTPGPCPSRWPSCLHCSSGMGRKMSGKFKPPLNNRNTSKYRIAEKWISLELERVPDPARRPGPKEKLVVNKPKTRFYLGPSPWTTRLSSIPKFWPNLIIYKVIWEKSWLENLNFLGSGSGSSPTSGTQWSSLTEKFRLVPVLHSTEEALALLI